ncbi:acyl-CoA dehydrogenase family protein [Novosphingobium sp. PS1R-30]|uniref:Acyl-CoA dehydrogenase family protein n=1 Tax=Novosphingobium anseongense TaxID=3133436 RepID=A0ABU8RTU7_9SPHN
MSIVYDEQQQAIARESRRVLDARVDKARLLGLLERTSEWDRTFWDTAIEQGWTALAVPEAQGGLGLGLIELGLVAQASGAATAGAPFLTSNYGAIRALAGRDGEAASHWLPKLASGEALAAIASAEGNAVLPSLPTVTFADGRLNGTKPGVTAGLSAHFAVVWASHGGEPALVLATLDGVARRAVDSFDNARLFADLDFADSPASLLATGDAARILALDILARQAVVTAHEQVGGAEALLFIARDYANERKAFGQPIGAFQSVKHRLAELYGLVEIARANAIHAASIEGQPGFLAAAAAARLTATEAYDTAARDAVQVHGGIGTTWESGLHLHMRRARSLAIEQGNMLFWEDILVDELAGASA